MKIYLRVVGIIIFLIIPTLFIMNMCGDAADTVKKEYSASAMLKKYEYFKDLSAAIDEKRATIDVYKSRLLMIKDQEGFEYQQTTSEMIGIISMHNSLCAQYNSAMSKFNYAFCNRGDMPESNLEPLPREVKPYILSF